MRRAHMPYVIAFYASIRRAVCMFEHNVLNARSLASREMRNGDATAAQRMGGGYCGFRGADLYEVIPHTSGWRELVFLQDVPSPVKRYCLPQAIVQVVHELHTNALVDASYVVRAHFGDPNCHRMLLVLCINGNRGALWYLMHQQGVGIEYPMKASQLTSSWMVAPGEVKPGHMILAPVPVLILGPL